MMIDFINTIMKNICLNIFSIIIFFKFINYANINNVKKFAIGITSIISSVVYVFFKENFDIVIAVFAMYLLQIMLLKIILKPKVPNVLIGIIISMSVTYILFTIAITLEFIFQMLFNINNKVINMALTLIIEFALICFLIRIKRLKNGLTFLQKQNEYVEITVVNISIILMLVSGLISYSDKQIYQHLYFYYLLLGIFMIIIVQKTLVMHYKQKLIDDTINQYKKELQEKDNEIKKLTDEAFKISKVNHEFYNRQKSLELMVKSKLQNLNIETAEEVDILNRIQEITSEHSDKMKELKTVSKLPLTDITEIDDMFKYMQNECEKNGINFKLNINGNIHYLVNNFIQKSKLETLIGDHIRDAIVAVNSSDSNNKEIFVILGVKDNCYELCIYDTGIEFEIQTLVNLGLFPITTHKDTGGSGIGFMTTFETLKECKASLIIEEKHPQNDSDYTKAVIIRFDGKNEYRISSYRLEIIKKESRGSRIIFL